MLLHDNQLEFDLMMLIGTQLSSLRTSNINGWQGCKHVMLTAVMLESNCAMQSTMLVVIAEMKQ